MKNALLRSFTGSGRGPACEHGAMGWGQGLPSESAFPGATSAPPCPTVSLSPPGCWLPAKANLCSPRVGGGVLLRSRSVDSLGQECLSAVMPGGPQNSGQVGLRGVMLAVDNLDLCQGRGVTCANSGGGSPPLPSVPVCTLTPWHEAFVTSSRWQTLSA